MRKTKMLTGLFLVLVILSCQKEKQELIEKSSGLSTRKFKAQDSIPPEILSLLRKDLIEDGYSDKAIALESNYNFNTGKRMPGIQVKEIIASTIPGNNYSTDEMLSRDFPTSSVSGVGTVLANVTFTENFGATKMYKNGESSIAFNSMNTGSAINAYDNTAPPAGTFIATPSGLGYVSGLQLPGLIGNISDIDDNILNTPVFLLKYSVLTSSGGWSSYVNSGDVAGVTSGCSSTSCEIKQIKIKLSSTGLMNLNDVNCGGLCPSTQVQAYIYYRVRPSDLPFGPGSWQPWVSADQASNSTKYLHSLQARVYFIKVN